MGAGMKEKIIKVFIELGALLRIIPMRVLMIYCNLTEEIFSPLSYSVNASRLTLRLELAVAAVYLGHYAAAHFKPTAVTETLPQNDLYWRLDAGAHSIAYKS